MKFRQECRKPAWRINTFESNVHEARSVKWRLNININCDLLSDGENAIYIYSFDEAGNFSIGNVRVNVIKPAQFLKT